MPREVSTLLSNARIHLQTGNAAEAVLEAEEALTQTRAESDAKNFQEALGLFCKAHLVLDKPNIAWKAAAEECENAKQQDKPLFEVAASIVHSEVLAVTNMPVEAVKKLAQASQKAMEVGDHHWFVAAAAPKVDAHLSIGDVSEAKATASELVEVSRVIQDPALLGQALLKLAKVEYTLEDFTASNVAANEAFGKFQLAKDRVGEVSVLEFRARLNLWGLSRKEEAKRQAQLAVALARETDSVDLLDQALMTMIQVLVVQDKKVEALRIAKDELTKVKQGTAKGKESMAWDRLASTYFEMGDDEAARKALKDGLEACSKTGGAEEAEMALAAAQLYLKLGMGDEALNAAQRGSSIFKRGHDAAATARATKILTDVKIARGEEPPRSVTRELAREQLKSLAKAVQTRSLKDFQACMEKLHALGSISQRDVDDILVPIFQEDQAGIVDMLKAYAEVRRPGQGSGFLAERIDEIITKNQQEKEFTASSGDKMYIPSKNVMYGGIWTEVKMGFGPRFQVCQLSAGIATRGQMVVSSASRQEHPDGDPGVDWEDGLLMHPGMIDSAIHNGSIMASPYFKNATSIRR